MLHDSMDVQSLPRFIPSEMTFTAAPESSCLAPPDPDKYTPKVFCTTALQQGKVSWDWSVLLQY